MSFFDIKSIAIVWASEIEWKLWNSMLKFLKNFKWEKYWVNPKWWSFKWIDFFPSISLLPIKVDICVFVIPANFVKDSLIEAGKNWIKRAIVISAWFKEVWNNEMEEEINDIIKEYDIKLLWPNCLWYVDTYKDLNLSFWTKEINKWNISIVSQSWAMAVAISDWALNNNLGFSKIITFWNKAWIDELDLLIELNNDKNTKLIVFYLESLERGEEFINKAKIIGKNKPIILLKSWISKKWQDIALSHTWAISSDVEIMFKALLDSWIHCTNNLWEFFSWINFFSKIDYKRIPNKVAIITNAWWPWVITTDYSEKYDVELYNFKEEETEILKKWLSLSASLKNPIDIIWDATSITYKQILDNFKELNKEITILILLTAQAVTDVENISKVIVEYKKYNEYIFTNFIWWKFVIQWKEILVNAWIIDVDDAKYFMSSYRELLKQKDNENKELTKIKRPNFNFLINLIKEELKKEKDLVWLTLTKKIFDFYNIKYVKEILVNDKNDIEEAYNEIKPNKIVAKISSKDILHKTDIWGVVLNINSLEELRKSYDLILKNVKEKAPLASISWITFSQMLEWDKNIFLGFKRDINFWNIMIIWMWWIYVNIFEDIEILVGIKSREEILEALKKIKYYKILEWARGENSINFDSLIETIFNMQFLFNDLKEIKEIDINPIICSEKDSIIVDSKLYL